MFCKMLWHDMKEGSLRTKRAWAIPALLFSVVAFRMLHNKNGVPGYTFGSVLFQVFGGVKYFPPETGRFQFPTLWVLIYCLSCFLTSVYPLQDVLGIGGQLMVRTGTRRRWWSSKILWIALQTGIFFLIGYGVLLLGCLIFGIPIALSVDSDFLTAFFEVDVPAPEPILRAPALFLGLPILFSVCLNLFQSFLSLMMPTVVAYGVAMVPLIGAGLSTEPIWIGNYAMAIRYAHVDQGGIDATGGLPTFLIMGAALCVVSVWLFQRYDIMPRRIDD